MATRTTHATIRSPKGRLSLSLRISALIMVIAILPLIFTVSIIELLSRPTLIAQTGAEMKTDAQAHAQLIDNYFAERILEAESLSRLPSIQNFVEATSDRTLAAKALESLATGHGRGSHYEDWSLFDLQGNPLLAYPTPPQRHGQYFILPDQQAQINKDSKAVLSPIFYNAVSNEAYIDIYTPVVTASYKLVGILRTSFDLQYVWDIVDHEAGANGPDSYAFILDQNGIRIAYTNTQPDAEGITKSSHLLTAIAPLSAKTMQQVNSAGLYGVQDKGTVPVLADDTLSSMQQHPNGQATFTLTPAEQHEMFQAARSTTYTVPWTYYVLSPLRTVTTVADQQRVILYIAAFLVLLVAAVIGLGVERYITRPILRSVDALHSNSEVLKTLSAQEENAVTEQTWVIEALQTGLHKVEYYSGATSTAAQRLSTIGNGLMHDTQPLNTGHMRQTFREIAIAANYIEKARSYQDESNMQLAAAIRVTRQVSEQLAVGATSTSEAAEKLEEVVNQLRAVVGK